MILLFWLFLKQFDCNTIVVYKKISILVFGFWFFIISIIQRIEQKNRKQIPARTCQLLISNFLFSFLFQQISIRWTYKLKWPEPRMLLNSTADWSTGEINVRGDMVDHFWTPDIIIHDLVSFYKPEILNQVAALEIKKKKQLYFKVR